MSSGKDNESYLFKYSVNTFREKLAKFVDEKKNMRKKNKNTLRKQI